MWSVKAVTIKRGDIYYADLRPVIGSEQGGIRPVLIVQNDTGNKHSPTVICVAITSKMNKAKLINWYMIAKLTKALIYQGFQPLKVPNYFDIFFVNFYIFNKLGQDIVYFD